MHHVIVQAVHLWGVKAFFHRYYCNYEDTFIMWNMKCLWLDYSQINIEIKRMDIQSDTVNVWILCVSCEWSCGQTRLLSQYISVPVPEETRCCCCSPCCPASSRPRAPRSSPPGSRASVPPASGKWTKTTSPLLWILTLFSLQEPAAPRQPAQPGHRPGTRCADMKYFSLYPI